MAPRTRPVTGRVTEPKPRATLSQATLEFCDWLIDGVTVAANHPDFEGQAKRVATAKKEVAAALTAAGGIPIGVQRAAAQE